MKRVGVVGAGAMGRNHVRVYREMANVDLVGVADADGESVTRVARMNGTRAYTDYREMIQRERPEALTVAVPTRAHCEVATYALSQGCHVLVEKPIAYNLEEARELVSFAARQGLVLMVGHVERYNPAILELKNQLDSHALGRIFQIHARRLGPFPHRVQDVGVVVDLATHDVDIMRYLTDSEAARVYAESKREVHGSKEDLVSGMLRFENDVVGLLEINWLTPTKIRELLVTGERGMFRADYLRQDLYFYENAEAAGDDWSTFNVLMGVSEGRMTRYALTRLEPLRAEQEAFLAATDGNPSGIVSGEDGMKALALALTLIESAQEHTVLAPFGRETPDRNERNGVTC